MKCVEKSTERKRKKSNNNNNNFHDNYSYELEHFTIVIFSKYDINEMEQVFK